MTIKTVEGEIDLTKPDLIRQKSELLRPGQLRGGKTASGGFFLEIREDGRESRRAELSPREAVYIAIAMLGAQGVTVAGLDPAKFRHFDG